MTNHIKLDDINPQHNLYIIYQPTANGVGIIKFGTVKYSASKKAYRPLNERIKDYLKYAPFIKVLYTGYRADCEIFESYIHRRYPSILMNEWYLPSMTNNIINWIESKHTVTEKELMEQKDASVRRMDAISKLFADVHKGLNPTFKSLLLNHYHSYNFDEDIITFEKWLTYQTGNDPLNEWCVNGFESPSSYFNSLKESCKEKEVIRKELIEKNKKKEYAEYNSLVNKYDDLNNVYNGLRGDIDTINNRLSARHKLYKDLQNPIINPDTSTWIMPKRFYFYDDDARSFRLDVAYVDHLRDNVKGNEGISIFRNEVIDYSLADNYKYDESLYIYHHPVRWKGEDYDKGGWVLCKEGLGALKKNADCELRRVVENFFTSGDECIDDYNHYNSILIDRDAADINKYKTEHYTNNISVTDIFNPAILVNSDDAALKNIDPALIIEFEGGDSELKIAASKIRLKMEDVIAALNVARNEMKHYKDTHPDNDWINKK